MNTYNTFIEDIFIPLSGIYGDHFLAIDETFEEIPSGLTYCIRPSFNFGDSYQATNLRVIENNIIVTLQIFKAHNSNADIIFIAEDIKERLIDLSKFKCNGYFYSINKIDFQKVYEAQYDSIAVLIYANKLGKIVEEEPWNPDEDEIPLTFLATKNSTIGISKSRTPTVSGLRYRYGLDGEWLTYEIDTILPVNKGQKIQFKNTLSQLSDTLNNYVYFVMTGEIEAYGNLASMINEQTTVPRYGFQRLFSGCISLKRSPKFTFSAVNDGSFASMFEGCINLEKASDILVSNMYANTCSKMFANCVSLKIAPRLAATTLGSSCYNNMFLNCTSLEEAPELPAMTATASCYSNMFQNCVSLKIAPQLPANILNSSCYYSMFNGCSSLKVAPVLSATTMATNCYNAMFLNCTSLEEAPELPALTLAQSCYYSMFNGCISLKIAPVLPATELVTTCYYQMFMGCTMLKEGSAISGQIVDQQSCYQMFYNCSNLTQVPDFIISSFIGTQNCQAMFMNCYSLVKAPALPATSLTNYCYQNMFYGCSSLEEAPELPATSLTNYCYFQMFYNCSSLKLIKVNFSAWTPAIAISNWVNGVQTVSGTFVCPSGLPEIRGNSNIPNNWTIDHGSPYNRELDYLQSTTSGEFIDSGIEFSLDGNFKIEAETSYQGAWRGIIIGTYGPNRLTFYLDWTSDYQVRAYAARGNNVYNNYSGTLNNEKHIVSLEYDSSTEFVKFIVDGVVKRNVALPSGTFTNTNNIRLFLDNRPNTTVIQNPVRIYYAKIWKNDALVRNYIPVMDNNNIPGMYDQVSENIFYNEGGGNFDYGEIS